MMSRFPTLLLILLSIASVRGEETRDLILVAGQSNAVGFDAYVNRLPADERDEKVLFWFRCGDPPPDEHDVSGGRTWGSLRAQPRGEPLSRQAEVAGETKYKLTRQYGNFADPAGGFGPEIGLARELLTQGEAPPAIVKVAFSGTSLSRDWNETESGEEGACRRALLEETSAALAAAKDKGISLRVRALVWVQGESDANMQDAAKYADNLSVFLAGLRKSFEAPRMIALVGVNTRFGNDRNPHVRTVIAAQKEAAEKDGLAIYVDTVGAETLPPSHTHFTAEGTLEIGKRYAQSLRKFEAEKGR